MSTTVLLFVDLAHPYHLLSLPTRLIRRIYGCEQAQLMRKQQSWQCSVTLGSPVNGCSGVTQHRPGAGSYVGSDTSNFIPLDVLNPSHLALGLSGPLVRVATAAGYRHGAPHCSSCSAGMLSCPGSIDPSD